jgi:hypothetical protein
VYRFVRDEVNDRYGGILYSDDDARVGVILNASVGRIIISKHNIVAFRNDMTEAMRWW